jgi:dienelactone hydrolase
MKRVLIIAGSILLVIILSGAFYVASGVDLPAVSGPYKAGATTVYLVDSSRDEIFSPNKGDKREILLTIYYPANPAPGVKPSPYVQGRLAEVMPPKTGMPGLLLGTVHGQSYDEAPAAQQGAPYPVLLFSQGLRGPLPVYSSLLAEVASHGYIIVCISHQYSDRFVVFPDGHAVYDNDAGTGYNLTYVDRKTSEQRLEKVMSVWADDTVFTLNQLDEINKSNKVLAKCLDLNTIGIFGHSFGGSTAAYMLTQDNRFKAGIDLDGNIYPVIRDTGIKKPFMMMASSNLSPYWFALSGDVYRAIQNTGLCYLMGIRGTGHISFVPDVAFIANKYSLLVHQDTGNINPSKCYRIITDYTIQFFDQELKGVHSKLLDEINPTNNESFLQKQTYPEVVLQKYSNK